MEYLWLLLIVLFVPDGYGLINCPPNKNECLCMPSDDMEFHCPRNYAETGGAVIHFKQNEKFILIDCYYDHVPSPKFFDVDLLPHANMSKASRMEMRFCSVPEYGFKEILEKLSVTDLEWLRFGSSTMDSVRLNRSHFEGLEKLKTLVIEKNKLVILDDDVFESTPNLIAIELTESDLRISSEVFKGTPLLKALDISGNHMEKLPEGLFRHVNKLEVLHLWNNNLTTIDESMFEDVPFLKTIELSVNNINSVAENAFRNLKHLEKVSLRKNKLSVVPANLFQGNPELKKVIMGINPALIPPDYLFANFSSLECVDLSNCNLESIPEHIFENSKNLKIVTLASNRLKEVPKSLFQDLQNLEEIELQSNFIEDISSVFASLNKLKKLSLEGNLITTIDKDTFEDLKDLEYINLNNNRISQIHPNAFYGENLQTIRLSHNMISDPAEKYSAIFQNVVNLRKIDLSHNRITQIDSIIAVWNKPHLEEIDLRYNKITKISLNSLDTITDDRLVVRLEHNNITTVDFEQFVHKNFDLKLYDTNSKPVPYSTIQLANNTLKCDCHNYPLLQHLLEKNSPAVQKKFEILTENLTCAGPVELRHFSLETLPPQLMTCPLEEMATNYTGCSDECACSWRPFDESVIIDCSSRNLLKVPEITLPPQSFKYNQSELHLENNYLTGLDRKLIDANVKKLYLSNNNISAITWLPPRLELLTLDNNEIHHLNYEVLDALNTTSLRNLTLYNNPWLCDCETENLTHFLRQHARQVDVNSIYCTNTTTRLVNLNGKDLCREWQVVYVIIPVMALLLTSAVLVALYYRYQKELKIWLFAKDLCLWWVTEEDLDKDKIYDAFISYSHKDEDFVIQNLLPRLEGGPNPYKLCLHFRNWIPGDFIAKQVTNSVLESRRTLVVLSPNFLESVWGKMEFRTAHTQAMTEGRARVIIVLYGDVDVNSLDSELKAYLKTNTYVKWGDPYFWNKLLYALPHAKRRGASHINHRHANVMNCIDDKFKLVAPVTASPGSTPPVLTLDATLLKKHPLTFVPSPDLDTPPAEAGKLLTSTCL